MKKTLSAVLCVLLSVILAAALATAVVAIVQIHGIIRDELNMVWAIAITIILPLLFLIGLGIWAVVTLIASFLPENRHKYDELE